MVDMWPQRHSSSTCAYVQDELKSILGTRACALPKLSLSGIADRCVSVDAAPSKPLQERSDYCDRAAITIIGTFLQWSRHFMRLSAVFEGSAC